MKTITLSLLLICAITCVQASPFPKRTKRVLFLGNSITYAGTYVSSIEAYLITHYPKKRYEFINVGLPSETVSGLSEPNHADGRFPRPDLHERLSRVLAQTQPDVVFACYGMNDGISMPLEEGRFRAYREGMKWLHTELEKAKSKRIIFLTPPVHDHPKLGTQGYNRTLDAYSTWLLAQRDTLNWEVADIHFPMTRYLEEKRRTDSTFKLAKDGVHPGELGHWLMAKPVLLYLGEKVDTAESIQDALADKSQGEAILKLVTQRQNVMKNAWLITIGHKRPEMPPGVSMVEAQQSYETIEEQIRALLKEQKRR